MRNTNNVLSVTQLTQQIKRTVSHQFSDVWVKGEVSGFSIASSGHRYLTLKDNSSQLSAIIWFSTAEQLEFDVQNGLEVVCRGYIDVYPRRGTYQLIIQQVFPVGQGALELAFRQLHARLAADGLFEDHHKNHIFRTWQLAQQSGEISGQTALYRCDRLLRIC